MNETEIRKEYARWVEETKSNKDINSELVAIKDDYAKIEDAFFTELAFGTGGLRGVLGAGTNRMNIYTVAKASQGLASYVVNHYKEGDRRIAISFDSRINSDLFARTAAEVFAANGIEVYIYKQLMPTPCVSYATRELKCSAGVMVTASHNPSKYNGYKVYGADGCQITSDAAKEIQDRINKTDVFKDVKQGNFDEGMKKGNIKYIPESIITSFIETIKKLSMLNGEKIDKNVAIVYSPLNGTGLVPVTRVLKETGFTNVTVVKEQEMPDGHFPTCPFPNPEIKEAMQLGMEYAKRLNADMLLATDPDCDRVGIAVKDDKGEYRLMTGNEVGLLLVDYICSRLIAAKKMPVNPTVIKTIVSTDLADAIAESYGAKTISVLTGFKYIGEQIAILEKGGHPESYLIGFEESYGYLTGTHARDKDAVNAAFLICEMFAYYKTHNKSLIERLNELYAKFGYNLNITHSYTFEGSAGIAKMKAVTTGFAKGVDVIGGVKVNKMLDYNKGIDGLPKSDVIKFLMDGHCSVVVRPSGTEPKLKTYVSVRAKNVEEASKIEAKIAADLQTKVDAFAK